MFKWGGTPERTVPHQLYNIKESDSLCPKGLEQEPPLSGGFHVQPQKGGHGQSNERGGHVACISGICIPIHCR
jgi:hypothetical protein